MACLVVPGNFLPYPPRRCAGPFYWAPGVVLRQALLALLRLLGNKNDHVEPIL